MSIAPESARRGWYRCEVVDVQAEMTYWKSDIQNHAFHEDGVPFARYEPVLRFAYDAYLRHPSQPLQDVLESIRHRYVEQFDEWRGMPWAKVEPMLQEVWIRMGAPTNGMRTGFRPTRTDAYVH